MGMKCPHCGAWTVIDSTHFNTDAARLCTTCNRIWPIDPSELRPPVEPVPKLQADGLGARLMAWWSRVSTARRKIT